MYLERLEERLAPAAGSLSFRAVDATPLLLRLSDGQVQIVNEDAPSQILASAAVGSITAGVQVEGDGQGVSLTIDASLPALPGGVQFLGGEGINTLIGPAVDTIWDITGPGSGDMGGPGFVQYSGVTNLRGGATGSDLFNLEPQGSIAGVIDGGPSNQGTLAIDGAAPGNEVFTASGRHSGTIALPGRTVNYAGMAPITQSGTASAVVITGTGDAQMTVTQSSGTITVSAPNMESISFSTPSSSLTLNGGPSNSLPASITFSGPLNLGDASLTANAEQITVPSTASITTTGSVSLSAATTGPVSFDITTVLTALGLPTNPSDFLHFDPSNITEQHILSIVESLIGSFATVTVQGNISAGSALTPGNISISADAGNDAGLSHSFGSDELLFHLTEATALVQGATLTATGGTVSVTSNNHGTRNTTNTNGNVVISVGIDRSDATLDGATVNANGLTLTATSAANYNITGSKALNLIDGDTTAAVTDGSQVNVTIGGAQITASEQSTISATSSGEGGLAAAANYVNKNTDAYVDKGTDASSSVTAAGGVVNIGATGNATITAQTTIKPPDGNNSSTTTTPVNAYVFAVNITTGNVAADVTGSTVTATGAAGNVTIQANNTAVTKATIDASGSPSSDTRSFELGVALNVVGFSLVDALNTVINNGIDSLLGTKPAQAITGTQAFAQDSTLGAGGSLMVTATDSAEVDATLTNNSNSGNGSSTSNQSVSTGAMLSFNLLNTNTQAYLSFTNPSTSPDVTAASGLTISANDTAKINATITLGTTSSGSQTIAGAVSFNDVSGGASASATNATSR